MLTDDTPSRILLPPAPEDQQALIDDDGVACWEEPVLIDTYAPGEPDRYPLFLDRRVFQGASGRVYPMPMIDEIAKDKAPRAWRAIHMENRYVRLMLLPELGGRIHIGYDKIAGYDFFYRNNVIKPALVGLLGPWISGGVEFNWPQHHRPATFLPVDSRIEREADGAVVVWHSDLDPLQRMRGTHGIRLRPGSSLVEAEVALHNRTDTAQTFLWWANVAARSHERYQSFFPDDVAYVADHARRALTAFPRADRPYYGVDYPALADERQEADRIDIYSNIPVPTSYMVTDTEDAFFGGYDHVADAGFVHWADPALSPGKKQWTWGDGPIGRAWDEQLTDGDGPYVELMAGVYTDNQPDFAWLFPGETKRFSQFWYPIHHTGPVRQATVEAAVSVSAEGAGTRIGVITTSPRVVEVTARGVDGEEVTWRAEAGPASPVLHVLDLAPAQLDDIVVRSGAEQLVRWWQRSESLGEPWVATAPPQPDAVESVDELYLTAVHLDQYRHPSRSAVPYLEEILRRDPADSRAATALAAHRLRRGRYDDAAELIARAVGRVTHRNLNPRDGEALYLAALIAERRGDVAAAERDLARAEWTAAWRPAARLARARLALRTGKAENALALVRDVADLPEARRVEVLALRALGENERADALVAGLFSAEPLDTATVALSGRGAPAPSDLRALLDVGAELARAGAWREALAVTEDAVFNRESDPGFGNAEPMRLVLRAAWAMAAGDEALALAERQRASVVDIDLANPAGLDHFDALGALIALEPGHGVARALRGTWLLDAGRYSDALVDLRSAVDAGLAHSVVWRNLALAIVHSGGNPDDADEAYLAALAVSADARLVFERDLLARIRGLTPEVRIALMRGYSDVLESRDDLALAYVTLLLDVGEVDAAWEILSRRDFRPFEGGEGLVIAAYDRAARLIARRLIGDGSPDAAVRLLQDGMDAPPHLGEGRHPAVPQAERLVVLGDALRAAGEEGSARAAWERARAHSPLAVASRPVDEADYWIGIAHVRLGERASEIWDRLTARAGELESARDDVDYFATSLPELMVFDIDTEVARREQARVLRELAEHGAREESEHVRMEP